ncbi:MAG TPA: electron transport complex subunit E, partial [Salinivirgaceae bacterium]|nr:electron transport complex subunit E [Salinivirgaceae bacterium]
MTIKENLLKGFFKENPVFVLLLGMCPTLATTSSAINGLGMGLATTFVLIMSNIVISLVKNLIPDKVRIPSFIVIIASFVTVVDLVMAGFLPDLHQSLGLFIPLIVVNCIVLGRAEAFASKNNPFNSMLDGISLGLGFSMALTILGSIREILGSGTVFGFDLSLFPLDDKGAPVTMLMFILAPGGFIV